MTTILPPVSLGPKNASHLVDLSTPWTLVRMDLWRQYELVAQVHMVAGRSVIAANAKITVGPKSHVCRVYAADEGLLADVVFGRVLAELFNLIAEPDAA